MEEIDINEILYGISIVLIEWVDELSSEIINELFFYLFYIYLVLYWIILLM